MYDIVIIGAGAAGMTAAIYAKRANKKVLVLEARAYGGQIINANSVENYPALPHVSGFDLATKLYNQVLELGTSVDFGEVTGLVIGDSENTVITDRQKYNCKSVIIATGTKNRKLGLDGEKELTGHGISYCATCDGAFYKNKDVALIGNSNKALEDAIYLSDIVNNVYIINKSDHFRADDDLISKLEEKDNVKFVYNSRVIKLNADNVLESIDVMDDNSVERNICVSGLFIQIGREPETDIFDKIVNVDDNGYIVAGEDCHTNVDSVFVAGDCRQKLLRQLVSATCDGAVAAMEAIKYLNNKSK